MLGRGMPEKRRFPIRLPEELFDRLAEIAQEEGRSVNNPIQYILRPRVLRNYAASAATCSTIGPPSTPG